MESHISFMSFENSTEMSHFTFQEKDFQTFQVWSKKQQNYNNFESGISNIFGAKIQTILFQE